MGGGGVGIRLCQYCRGRMAFEAATVNIAVACSTKPACEATQHHDARTNLAAPETSQRAPARALVAPPPPSRTPTGKPLAAVKSLGPGPGHPKIPASSTHGHDSSSRVVVDRRVTGVGCAVLPGVDFSDSEARTGNDRFYRSTTEAFRSGR